MQTKIPSRADRISRMQKEQIQACALMLKSNYSSALSSNARAHEEQQKLKDGESRLIRSEGISRPTPRSERRVQVKIARKIHAAESQKKHLDGLYEVLAPGSTVGKISPTTSVAKEPNRPEVRVRNSDIAKFAMQNKRNTELSQYIDRRPKKVQEKTLEQKIIKPQKERNYFEKIW